MNLLELWWLLEKPVFQEVGSGFHKKFDQLLDHNWFSYEFKVLMEGTSRPFPGTARDAATMS